MQKRNTKSEKQLVPKCRINSSFIRVTYFMKKVPKYLIYLINWGTRCWMTRYATQSGHFSVITTGNGEPKKFLVGLNFLSYPPFVRLLEAAEREFGFEQQGVLAIPCEASKLQQILLHV
ncbi:hypothetical protein Pfo_004234 [Paulownia fortunei]|nr:hypothetical protein Pfo_004234 [Paulownia fortunei]